MATAQATAGERMLHELLPSGRRYVALPTRRHPLVVAEDRPEVLHYVRRSLLAVPPSLPAWWYPAASAALAVPSLPRRLPPLAVTPPDDHAGAVRRTSGDIRRLTAAGPVVLIDRSHEQAGRVLLLVFPPGGTRPVVAVRIPADHRAARSVLSENERLRAVAALPLGAARPAVPTVLGLLRHNGLAALATDALPGVSMEVACHRRGHHARPGPVRADFAAAADWLADLQSATAGPLGPLDLRPGTAEALQDLLPPPVLARFHRLRRGLRRHLAPLGVVHGDFRPGSLLLRDGRISGVVDWEHARTTGSPLADPARFVVSYCGYLTGRTHPGHRVPGHHGLVAGPPGAALAYALHGSGWFPRLVHDFLAGVLHRLGLPDACGPDAVLAELAAMAAETDDPHVARTHALAFSHLVGTEETPRPV
ncbi:phosphotransferase [Streptomyces sp. NPDC093094]|uniref:phosphotransferase n=1 Tax=Streptomyces sp. NPDC093094 TaxID=3366026 RepID=UPI003800AAAA